MPTNRFPNRPLRYLLPGLAIALAAAPRASAQRGGGRGGRSGDVNVVSTAMQKTPVQRVKDELRDSDPVDFINDHSRQLELDKAQKDSFKKLHKEMQEEQKPIFKELEKVYSEMERNGGGGGFGGAGMPRGESGGGEPPPTAARLLTGRLIEVQTSYGEKASTLLNEAQRHINDSLSTIYKAELRDKQAKARSRGRGRG